MQPPSKLLPTKLFYIRGNSPPYLGQIRVKAAPPNASRERVSPKSRPSLLIVIKSIELGQTSFD